MNTWGIRSINTNTFNLKYHSNYIYPQEDRDVVTTFMRVHNLTLNVLGYMGQRFSLVSGCVRMGTGFLFVAVTTSIGKRNTEKDMIIQHWYDEARLTGIAQITRGALEAFVPYGRVANGVLDVLGTARNLVGEVSVGSVCEGCMQYLAHRPYPDPSYPVFFWPLYFV